MKITTYACDVCGRVPCSEIGVITGTHVDNAGSVDNDIRTVELCVVCMGALAKTALYTMDAEDRAAILDKFKPRKAAEVPR